jgi:hypothetical protein
MKTIYGGTENSLSSSGIGSISKCSCCDSYNLTLGNITLRLSHRDVLTLTEMLIEALELNAMCDLNEKEFRRKDA